MIKVKKTQQNLELIIKGREREISFQVPERMSNESSLKPCGFAVVVIWRVQIIVINHWKAESKY